MDKKKKKKKKKKKQIDYQYENTIVKLPEEIRKLYWKNVKIYNPAIRSIKYKKFKFGS